MNATSRGMPGPHATTSTVAAAAPAQPHVLRDAMSRVQRALDALRDGDREFATDILDDLVADLWNVVEREERHA
jgi:hypothetical protein